MVSRVEKQQNRLFWALVITETSHVFCCFLPTLFSILSLLGGLGLISATPVGVEFLHDIMHDWELPMIVLSGVILVLGWGLYLYSRKIDCHDSGCHHGPCDSKKKKTNVILKIATILFIVNVSVYTLFHREGALLEAPIMVEGVVQNDALTTGHEAHHGHDH